MSDYEKLKQIANEIPNLISANIDSDNPTFQAWKSKTERFLIKKYGEISHEYDDFQATQFSPLSVSVFSTSESDLIEACQNGLRRTQSIFQTYLDEMAEMAEKEEPSSPVTQNHNFTKLFIVHGHDGELKESVARIIEKQGIEAIILSEIANQGKTMIEKIEKNSDVGGAICLFTADDI